MVETTLTFLKKESTPATVLLSIAVGKYGLDCFEWFPALLRKELHEDCDVDITDLQADKIQAAIIILTTDLFETNWQVFNVCVRLLNNEYADFETFEPLEAEFIAGAMPEIEYLRNGDEDGIIFSDEVNVYAGLVFSEYGCSKAPDVFPTAIMPTGLNDGDMKDKNEALKEMYQAKKDHLEQTIKKSEEIHQVD